MKRHIPFPMDTNPNLAKVARVESNLNFSSMELINPYRVTKHQREDIIELAKEIAKADSFIVANTCGKLEVIAQQMNFLKEQAKSILNEAKKSIDLNHAACNFVKKPGHVYYLYQRESGQKYFSMLSPQEWTSSYEKPPHLFLGSYFLRQDLSWIPEEQMNEQNIHYLNEMQQQLLHNNHLSLTN